ncbi:MAG TPA: radical SAM protein [Thermoanaerobaculia bacterium]|nr:radical SAM protein [Thermoanaerobaculia bacterium]
MADLVQSPFLHVAPDRIHNPLTDLTLLPGESGFDLLAGVANGALDPAAVAEGALRRLEEQGWLIPSDGAARWSQGFHLKYVGLEAHTLCNQGCYFCPVSVSPREPFFMPMEQYRDIVEQLAEYRATIETVFMINYNEPTADKRFIEQVRTLKEAGLPPSTLTNGTGLTPARVDEIVEMGGLRYLSINLSTLDQERYRSERLGDHLSLVLRNLDYAKDRRVADEMDVIVLGRGDDTHQHDFEEIRARFEGSLFNVRKFEVMDRAGYLQIGLSARNKTLCGCDNLGSRPFQHVHITPHGKCLLCCEDYDENYVVGDLNEESLSEVLTGPKLALLRRWVYGVEEAPEDFICRNCVFARTR